MRHLAFTVKSVSFKSFDLQTPQGMRNCSTSVTAGHSWSTLFSSRTLPMIIHGSFILAMTGNKYLLTYKIMFDVSAIYISSYHNTYYVNKLWIISTNLSLLKLFGYLTLLKLRYLTWSFAGILVQHNLYCVSNLKH